MKKLLAQLMRFGLVGIAATLLDYALLVLLTEVFSVPYMVSATISFSVSLVFNYLASMRYVFAHREEVSRSREFIIFVVLSLIGLAINNGCLWLGVELMGIDYRITKLGAIVIVMAWNFITRKLFIDRREV